MKITEVRIFPTESKDGKLKAFATMTFDDWFVVRNVKVIQGSNGLFVAMPSRKAMDACPKCRFKNVVGAKYCNQCGSQLELRRISEDPAVEAQGGDHMDIAHPITQECRVYIQDRILEAYQNELAKGPSLGARESQGQQIGRFGRAKEAVQNHNITGATQPRQPDLGKSSEKRQEDRIVEEEAKDIEL